MIKFLLFLLLILFSSFTFSVSKIPSDKQGTENGIDLRILKKLNDFILIAENKNRKELLDQDYHQVLLGTYYRLNKNLRFGIFAQAEQGLRWDGDWIKNSAWEWQNISGRWDFSTIADATYADKISSLFSWEWKNRFLYYHSRESLLLKTRPGLRYFFLKENRPWWQLYTEFEAYVPVNYGVNAIYETWIYFGGLYQLTDELSIGPMIALRERWFHAYPQFESKTGEKFRANFSSTYVGINLIYNLP